jgi:hypothetical protein
MPAMGATKSDFALGGWGCAFPDPSLDYEARIWFAIFLVTFRPILGCKGCMNTTTNQTLDIQGTQFDYAAATARMALSAACIGLGIFLWPLREHTFWGDMESVDEGAAWLFASIPWFIAAILPYRAHKFLDCRPLSDFGCIAVRHVCHPGGEGPDTFTGSVGLHPTKGETVFWLKEFSTTQDEMPREAYEFAITLQKSLPLPMTVLGLEFLDLEKTKFLQSATPPETDQASRSVGMPRRPGAGLSLT